MPKGLNEKAVNTVKLVQKHLVEGKTIKQSAEEIGVTERQAYNYKSSDEYRHMAIELLENSKLKGLAGTISQLVKALDATKPIVTEDADGGTHVTRVPDNKTRMEALKEVIQIYGLKAPERKDATVTIAFSSDEELFGQIEQAQRECRFVESVEKFESSPQLVAGESTAGCGGVVSRQRTLLQVDAVPEPE